MAPTAWPTAAILLTAAAGTELEDVDSKTTTLLTAREPRQAPIFNYASMAHNCHFFFQGLSPGGTPPPAALVAELEASFSSLESLRREFVLTAGAMFGPGFLWLVRAGPADYRLLPTYLAGSPYPGAHWRQQPTEMQTRANDGSAANYFRNNFLASRSRRPPPPTFASASASPASSTASPSSSSSLPSSAPTASAAPLPPGGINLEPLLCLNTWEHAWLLDWGFGSDGQSGKMAYVEAWWNLIDWNKVAQRSGVLRPDFKSATQP